MKRFHFKLEKVLKLRSFREQEAEMELARAIGALTVIENKIKETAVKRAEAASIRFLPNQRAVDIFYTDLYITRLDKQRDKLLEEAAKAELVVEDAREKFREASRERKIVDKLKERKFKEYKDMVKKEEIKTIDDLSGGKTAREALVKGV